MKTKIKEKPENTRFSFIYRGFGTLRNLYVTYKISYKKNGESATFCTIS